MQRAAACVSNCRSFLPSCSNARFLITNDRITVLVNRRSYALSPTPKLKTYGTLHSNVRQLLRVVHPDTFRPHLKEDNPKAEEFKKLSMINQRSLQALNGFNSTMKNFERNMNTFLKGTTESVPIEFNILKPGPLETSPVSVQTIRTGFVYPHISKHVWVRHSNPVLHMNHWRDVQFLDLLHRANMAIAASLDINLLPSNQEIEVFQSISRETRIPMPVQFNEPTISYKRQPHIDKDQEFFDIPYEDQKQYEMDKKLKEQGVLWREPENSSDLYSLLRKQNLKESRHPRSPEFHMNKKFSVIFKEPSKDQLKKMLSLMQIDFPAGTEPQTIRTMHQFLINNAKELKIWEWYHSPIIIGAERYSLIDHTILGIPFDCNVERLNMYLEKNLPVIQKNEKIFHKRLDVIADKMLQLRDHLCLFDIKTDIFVTHDKIEACLDHLLDSKELLDSYNMNLITLRIHNVKNLPYFSQMNGTVCFPYDITGTQLREFLIKCKKLQYFANFRIARSSINHMFKILNSKLGVENIEIPRRIKSNTVAYQSLLGRLLNYVAEYAPYNTLKNLRIVVKDTTTPIPIRFKEGVLYLPVSFKPREVDEYLQQRIATTKNSIDKGRIAPSTPKLKMSHIASSSVEELRLETQTTSHQ